MSEEAEAEFHAVSGTGIAVNVGGLGFRALKENVGFRV